MADEIIELRPIIRQIAHRELGKYASCTNAEDTYWLFQFVNVIRKVVGEEEIKEHYGEKYEDINKRLMLLNSLVNKIKSDYDFIRLRKSKSKEYEIMIEKRITYNLSRIPLLQQYLYDMLVFLVSKTSLQFQNIPADAFKQFDIPKLTKLSQDTKKPREPTSEQQEEVKDEP